MAYTLEPVSGVGSVKIVTSPRLLGALMDVALAASDWADLHAFRLEPEMAMVEGLLPQFVVEAEDSLFDSTNRLREVLTDEHRGR